jgi:hypothetical protein
VEGRGGGAKARLPIYTKWGHMMKREKGTKTTQQNKGVKTSTIRVPGRVLNLCLRRKRVGGRVYIHEWQSRAELRDDYTFPHYNDLSHVR